MDRDIAIPLIVACAVAIATAGCIQDAGRFSDLYADADFRWAGSFSGGLSEKRCFEVPHQERLDVFMRYEIHGEGAIRLHVQDGPVQDFPLAGTSDVTEEPWNTFDPVFGGQWCFEVDTSGNGDFAFAFYVR